MTDILKERLSSPQNLGHATCKLWGRGWPYGVIQHLGLLPANKIFAGFCQCLAAFWRVICHWRHIDTYIVLSQRKRLESFAVWSKRSSIESDDRSCCSSRRCEVELELSHSFTPAIMKCALLTAFVKRSNREDLKISLVRVSFHPEFLPNRRKMCQQRV